MFFNCGDYVHCTIKGIKLTDARICIDRRHSDQAFKAYICHNISELSGSQSPNMYGYRYSWAFEYSNGKASEGVRDLYPIINKLEQKKDVVLSDDLFSFFRLYSLEKLMSLLYYKFGIFDDFNKYDLSTNSGFLLLTSSSTNKSVEIKVGRFFKQIFTKYLELNEKDQIGLNDKELEKIHNDFVAYQKNDHGVQFLSGEDILKGYKKANYPEDNGSQLHKSCMVDRCQYLSLYTKNPNQVQLAVVNIDGKIAARVFVWTTVSGERVYDRIYFAYEWLNSFVSGKLEKMGIKPIIKENFQMVQLENWTFEQYPYLDHFYTFNVEKGYLLWTNVDNVKIRHLRNTDGRL
jgi:hypothetical protein